MVKVSPEIYSKYVTINSKGRKELYVKLKKALYGCLRSALLSYLKLASDRTKMGFKINFYEPCVSNKMVRGKRLTICSHVDNLKISHVDKNIVIRCIRDLEKIYGKCTTSRGKYHEYLGMELDFRTKKKVKIDMREYVCETYKMFPEDLGGHVSTPAAEHLREINEDAEKLDTDLKQTFHIITARSLFCGKRARPDLQLTIAFLCTRVRYPD